MKSRLFKFAALMLTVFFISIGNAGANLIQNGSFELGDYSGNNGSWERLSNGDTRLNNWIIGGNGVDWHNTVELFPSYNGVPSERMIDLNLDGFNGSGTISQQFATTAGAWYAVTFSMASPFGAGAQVTVDGFSQTFTQSGAYPMAWELKSFAFQADDSMATLMFLSADPGPYWGPVLDNISVVQRNAVPEPTTMLLLGFGLMGVLGVKKKFNL